MKYLRIILRRLYIKKYLYIINMNKTTTSDFISKAQKKHGDKYDYSKVIYVNSKTPITIYCKKHKIWYEQIPNVHLNGIGCPMCAQENRVKTRHNKLISFNEAKKIVSDLDIKSQKEYINIFDSKLSKLRLPKCPEKAYISEGWKSWPDFLQNGRKSNSGKFISYNELKDILKPLNFSSVKEYNEWYSKNKDVISIPAVPKRCYKEFISWDDLLGNKIYQSKGKTYVSYDDAKKFASSLNLTGKNDWVNYCKYNHIPEGIPPGMCVRTVYLRDGVDFSWGDFLGTGRVSTYKTYVDKLKHRSSICKTLIDKSDLLLIDKSTIRLLYIYLKCFDSELAQSLKNTLDLSAEERVEEISSIFESINEKLESSDIDEYVDEISDDDEIFEEIIVDDEPMIFDDDSINELLLSIEHIKDEYDFDSLDDKSKKYLNEVFECYIRKVVYKEILQEY